MAKLKKTFAVLVENKPGVLARISGLFSRRGFNIDSLVVGTTEKPDISRMTIVVEGDDRILEQVRKQLNKLINVIKISYLLPDQSVERELALIKVSANSNNRSEIMQIVDVFRASIIDVQKNSLIIEITGNSEKINAMEQLLRQYGIKEMMRTGKVAMSRGAKVIVSE